MEVRGYMKLDNDFTYNGSQCEVGGEYENTDNMNFLFFKNPLDLLKEYDSIDNRYAVVIGSGLIHYGPSVFVTQKICIEREISLRELVEAGVKYAVDAANENMDSHLLALNNGCNLIVANYRDWSLAFNVNDCSIAVNTGRHSTAASRGNSSAAVVNGKWSVAVSRGYCSAAISMGDHSAAIIEEKGCIAISLGYKAKAKACIGSWLVLADWQEREDGFHVRDIKSFYVDGVIVKADTFYRCEDGKLVEVG